MWQDGSNLYPESSVVQVALVLRPGAQKMLVILIRRHIRLVKSAKSSAEAQWPERGTDTTFRRVLPPSDLLS